MTLTDRCEDRAHEERCLRLIEEREVASAAELAFLDAVDFASAAPGARLDALVKRGLLGEDSVHTLLAECAGGDRVGERRTQTFDSHGADRSCVEVQGTLDRYELAELLGEGGMGKVYRAWDTVLEREVALKILPRDDEHRLRRFLREARAQAAVDHDNVCRVYEAGDSGSAAFIAMQLIRGQTLEQAAADMSYEAKALVLEQVAEGLHAAHRQGLIHRDIKPGNIMVTSDDRGGWHAHVLDFGIAKAVEGPELTGAGVISGTPAYMAPEQINGEVLDRRVDIFALGATLYALLAGKPPFEGSTSVDVMIAILNDEPKPLRRVDPKTPRDLETIVGCCLEKDPNRRYPSARALAEDLRHFVDGEPIVARPPAVAYRLGKALRRHRAVAAVSAVAAAAVLLLGGMWWHARWSAAQAAEMAQGFGQEVERIDSMMRLAHVTPVHDLRPEKQRIRARMAHIEEQMRRVGRIARGPGSYALGRAHLALGETEEARLRLDQAWQFGLRTQAAAYGLGLALGTLYQQGLAELRQIRDDEQRAARRQHLVQELRDPALEYLRLSEGYSEESPHYVAGLIALYEQRYDDAVSSAQAALAEQPSLYEARRLTAEAQVAQAVALRDRGELEAAEALLRDAETSYRLALEVGENDPEVHEGLCRLYSGLIEIEVWGKGVVVDTLVQAALPSCATAVRIDPERVSAMEAHAYTGLLWAQALRDHGQDPEPGLTIARQVAGDGLQLHPDAPRLHRLLGTAAWLEAAWDFASGQDPGAALEQSVSHLERAVELDPTFMTALVELGLAYQVVGRVALSGGKDPSDAFARSVAAYEQALLLNPDDYKAPHNLATTLLWWGNYQVLRGLDPTATLRRAATSARRSLELNPEMLHSQNNLALSQLVLGQYQAAHGSDPAAAYGEAIRALSATLDTQPDYLIGLVNRALTHVVLATDLIGQGRPAEEQLRAAERDAARVLELTPQDPSAHLQLGRVWHLRARAKLATGEDPAPDLRRALDSLDRAVALNPRDLEYHVVAATCRLDQLAYATRAGGRTAPTQRLRDQLDGLLAADPENADGLRLRGELETLLGRQARCGSESAEVHFTAAAEALSSAAAAADSAATHDALAELHLWQARCLRQRRQDASSVIDTGVAAANAALTIDGRSLDAEALALSLRSLRRPLDEHAAGRVAEILARRPDLDALMNDTAN